MRRFLCSALFVVLFGCATKVPVGPPETFEETLKRTEGVSCADITGHDSEPAPDCRKMYEAWQRGRARVVKFYPQAAAVRMVDVFFFRPKVHWVDDKPYPLINLMPEGAPPVYARGTTSPEGPVLIQTAYEECVEHEAVHGITRLVDGSRRRTPEAIDQDPGQDPYYGSALEMYYAVQCHGVPDDAMGDGIVGKRDQCALPYSGSIH